MSSDDQFAFMAYSPSLAEVLQNERYESIRLAANRLQNRLKPMGSPSADSVLTASRALIEAACKTLLDFLDIVYDNKKDLADISRKLLKALDLHPGTRTARALKQQCQGAINMINGIACLRNSHGDAPGQGSPADAIPFHPAELAAYLSCAVTRYLVQCFETKIARKGRDNLTQSEASQLVAIWLKVAKTHKITNPDNLPYSTALEEIAQNFTQKAAVVVPRRDIYLLLVGLRKASKLPRPQLDD